MEMEEEIEQEGKPKGKIRKKSKKSYYPWGTYRTMKKIYKLEGKQKEENASRPFDEALTKAVNETFWD